MKTKDQPQYYGGRDNPYEAIKVIECWNLPFNLSTALKYISRLGKKDNEAMELNKIRNYIIFEIRRLRKQNFYQGRLPQLWPDHKYDLTSIVGAWKVENFAVVNLLRIFESLTMPTDKCLNPVGKHCYLDRLKRALLIVDILIEVNNEIHSN